MSGALALMFRSAMAFDSPLMEQVAVVIADLVEHGQLWSQSAIRKACYERGVVTPTHGTKGWISDGTVNRTLVRLREAGCITWATAYVRRWHWAWEPQPGQPRVAWTTSGWRLPCRRIDRDRDSASAKAR